MPIHSTNKIPTARKRKSKDDVRVVCCFSHELLPTHDPEKVSYSFCGKEVIGFKYQYFKDITNRGRNYFPKLPKNKPKEFDIIQYLGKTVEIINDEKKRDLKRKKNTTTKIVAFLNKTGLSYYIRTEEFIKSGLKPTPTIEPVVIKKKFRK
jgi:hypothetical protein